MRLLYRAWGVTRPYRVWRCVVFCEHAGLGVVCDVASRGREPTGAAFGCVLLCSCGLAASVPRHPGTSVPGSPCVTCVRWRQSGEPWAEAHGCWVWLRFVVFCGLAASVPRHPGTSVPGSPCVTCVRWRQSGEPWAEAHGCWVWLRFVVFCGLAASVPRHPGTSVPGSPCVTCVRCWQSGEPWAEAHGCWV